MVGLLDRGVGVYALIKHNAVNRFIHLHDSDLRLAQTFISSLGFCFNSPACLFSAFGAFRQPAYKNRINLYQGKTMGWWLYFNRGKTVFYGIESRAGIDMVKSRLKAASQRKGIRYLRLHRKVEEGYWHGVSFCDSWVQNWIILRIPRNCQNLRYFAGIQSLALKVTSRNVENKQILGYSNLSIILRRSRFSRFACQTL